MKKAIEATEQITVFRDPHGALSGIVIAQEESAEPFYGAFIYCPVKGWHWFAQSRDKGQVLHEAREYFAYHSHECPKCLGSVECSRSYRCEDPDKDELCDECQDKPTTPEDAHLESTYEARTELFD